MSSEWASASWVFSPVGLSHTPQRIANAIVSFLTQVGWERASWSGTTTDQYLIRSDYGTSDVWAFTGDGPTQKCGIRVYVNAASSRIELHTFLENMAASAAQKTINTANVIFITYDNTQDNTFTFIGGENGFYGECGTLGQVNNVAHWAIVTHQADSTLSFTRDAERSWTSQGICLDLFGHLKFTEDWNYRFVEPDGSRRNHTARLRPYVCRGTPSVLSNTPTNDVQVGIGSRDSIFCVPLINTNGYDPQYFSYTFGTIYGTLDDRYRISPMMCVAYQGDFIDIGHVESNAAVIFAAGDRYCRVLDPRSLRRIPYFSCMSSLILPWNNVTDAITSTVYRAAQVADGGRNSMIGVQWPSSTVSISATP